jgi:hypothetical protein
MSTLECSKCEGELFRVEIAIDSDGWRLAKLVCARCGQPFDVVIDDQDRVVLSGYVLTL